MSIVAVTNMLPISKRLSIVAMTKCYFIDS